MTDNAWDLGGGGQSFPFDHIGDEIEGFIQDVVERQSTDLNTGEPDYWDAEKTRPKMVTVVTLQTNLRESAQDDGLRNVTLAGSKKPESRSRMAAVYGAVKAATGGTSLQYNAWLKMKYVADGQKTKPAFSPPKFFEAWYRPPVHDLDGGTNAQAPAPSSQLPPVQHQQPPAQYQQPPLSPNPGPEWAQQPAQPAAQPAAGGITRAQVDALRAAGVDPAVVYGADWETKVVA
jgi:hypothetical protein